MYCTGEPYLVTRDEGGQLRGHYNVCRHHAAALVREDQGRSELLGTGGRVLTLHHARVSTHCFKCPYHGWTYGLDGRLTQARRLRGIQQFRWQR